MGGPRRGPVEVSSAVDSPFPLTTPVIILLRSAAPRVTIPLVGQRFQLLPRVRPQLESQIVASSGLNLLTSTAPTQLLLNQVKNSSSKNFALSPVSIDAALGMVAAGSRGPTLERMLALLGTQDVDELKLSASAMMATANCGGEGGDGPVLCMVNGAWVDNRFPLVDSYEEEVLKGIYGCDAETVDFLHQADEVVNKVNSWAEDASKGLITNLLQPDLWKQQSSLRMDSTSKEPGLTNIDLMRVLPKTRDFYLLTGDTVSVQFMTGHKRYHYESFDGFKVLKIPYQSSAELNRKFSMYFFLPHEKVGLQNLLEELCSNSGFTKQDYFNLREVSLDRVRIPKFEFSYNFDVSTTMEEIGMTFPSVENPEDFSEMMKIPEGIPFFATKMIQKVVVKVDEKGTKAAAVTYGLVSGCRRRGQPPPKPSFIADHPFMFVIKEEISGLLFFVGAVLNPSL